jgi:hypothetical protein
MYQLLSLHSVGCDVDDGEKRMKQDMWGSGSRLFQGIENINQDG